MPELAGVEARRRFAAARVARLATVDGNGRPHLVPVVFALHGADGIVTAVDHKPKSTTRLKRLRNIAARPSVCLLADAYDENWDHLWWVRADGEAVVVPADAALVGPLRAKYPQYREHPPAGAVVLVTVTHWTGWQAAPL
ncbi:TIGR03668 family PPOX class F420-dependent oxidoreductase [Streptomyces sp900105755]|uniref:TIGR03668 family PPOX class F420-dependent oxidoreductase n=1 Tax=unclassified Streptomyces TaxID=2593676 RepID=UPI00089987C0|nr:TIGR03668 family PPOX class F420-dependent oxidoreductase [Streptomyces sp. Ag109_O5-10]SEE31435.1 PPOX class probable F420-dependent enzyme, Rv0121 family [Streptomyces sp. Ag109_O5-10]